MNARKMFGFAGWSGSGKTTLIEQLIPRFVARGLRVSLVKHAHHTFDVDHAGKDSWRHRQAGCMEVMIGSGVRWALMHELRGAREPSLEELVAHMSPCDLLLVEGFKRYDMPKLEVYRAANDKPLIHPEDGQVVAIAADVRVETHLPQLDLNDADAIAAFVLKYNGFA